MDYMKNASRNLRDSKKALAFVFSVYLTFIGGVHLGQLFKGGERKNVEQEREIVDYYGENIDFKRYLHNDLKEGFKLNYPITNIFVNNIIQIESTGNPRAESHEGARGLMQIMPSTWAEESGKLYGKELDFDEANDPKKNREVGEFYMGTIREYLSERIGGWSGFNIEDKQELIAAAYNGGMGRLVRNGGDISKMPLETRKYVERLRNIRLQKP